jgi:hypothetical protein
MPEAGIFPDMTLGMFIARATGIDAELPRESNAELRRGIRPPDGYDLRVSLGHAGLVASHANDLPIQ